MTINVMAQQETEDPDKLRKKAAKLQKDGNHKEALGIYQTLLGNEHSSNVKLSGNDLNGATSCLQELKRSAEIDELIENALAKQPNNPSLLDRAGTVSPLGWFGLLGVALLVVLVVVAVRRRTGSLGRAAVPDLLLLGGARSAAEQVCRKSVSQWSDTDRTARASSTRSRGTGSPCQWMPSSTALWAMDPRAMGTVTTNGSGSASSASRRASQPWT